MICRQYRVQPRPQPEGASQLFQPSLGGPGLLWQLLHRGRCARVPQVRRSECTTTTTWLWWWFMILPAAAAAATACARPICDIVSVLLGVNESVCLKGWTSCSTAAAVAWTSSPQESAFASIKPSLPQQRSSFISHLQMDGKKWRQSGQGARPKGHQSREIKPWRS